MTSPLRDEPQQPVNRRKQKRVHMMAWAMLTHGLGSDYWSWMYLMQWAMLGGTPDEVPQ